jgi:hypothetical protein
MYIQWSHNKDINKPPDANIFDKGCPIAIAQLWNPNDLETTDDLLHRLGLRRNEKWKVYKWGCEAKLRKIK